MLVNNNFERHSVIIKLSSELDLKMVEDQSFEVLENSENSKSGATPSASMVLRAKERVKTLWAHSDELIANLKQHVDQFGAQDNPLDLTENQVENQDFGSVKVFDVCFFRETSMKICILLKWW